MEPAGPDGCPGVTSVPPVAVVVVSVVEGIGAAVSGAAVAVRVGDAPWSGDDSVLPPFSAAPAAIGTITSAANSGIQICRERAIRLRRVGRGGGGDSGGDAGSVDITRQPRNLDCEAHPHEPLNHTGALRNPSQDGDVPRYERCASAGRSNGQEDVTWEHRPRHGRADRTSAYFRRGPSACGAQRELGGLGGPDSLGGAHAEVPDPGLVQLSGRR